MLEKCLAGFGSTKKTMLKYHFRLTSHLDIPAFFQVAVVLSKMRRKGGGGKIKPISPCLVYNSGDL